MRIKGLKTNETSFKNAQDENQTEDTGPNLEYDIASPSFYCRQFFGLYTDSKKLLTSTICLLESIFPLNLKHNFLVMVKVKINFPIVENSFPHPPKCHLDRHQKYVLVGFLQLVQIDIESGLTNFLLMTLSPALSFCLSWDLNIITWRLVYSNFSTINITRTVIPSIF